PNDDKESRFDPPGWIVAVVQRDGPVKRPPQFAEGVADPDVVRVRRVHSETLGVQIAVDADHAVFVVGISNAAVFAEAPVRRGRLESELGQVTEEYLGARDWPRQALVGGDGRQQEHALRFFRSCRFEGGRFAIDLRFAGLLRLLRLRRAGLLWLLRL